MNLQEFIDQAKQDNEKFEHFERCFQSLPDLAKLKRDLIKENYSYIWYEDTDGKKVVVRLANKDLDCQVLGAGTYGRVKYGVDKEGQLYAINIRFNNFVLLVCFVSIIVI